MLPVLNYVWKICLPILAFTSDCFSNEFLFHILWFTNIQNTSIWGAESQDWLQTTKFTARTNSLFCCAPQKCGMSKLSLSWNGKKSQLLSIAGRLRTIKSSTSPIEVYFPAGDSSSSRDTSRRLPFGWKFFKFMDWKLWSFNRAIQTTGLSPMEQFPLVICAGSSVSDFST